MNLSTADTAYTLIIPQDVFVDVYTTNKFTNIVDANNQSISFAPSGFIVRTVAQQGSRRGNFGAATESGGKLSVYASPNPAANYAQLRINNPSASLLNIQMISLNGVVVKSWVISANKQPLLEVDLSNYAKGIYLVKVQSASETVSTKLVHID